MMVGNPWTQKARKEGIRMAEDKKIGIPWMWPKAKDATSGFS